LSRKIFAFRKDFLILFFSKTSGMAKMPAHSQKNGVIFSLLREFLYSFLFNGFQKSEK